MIIQNIFNVQNLTFLLQNNLAFTLNKHFRFLASNIFEYKNLPDTIKIEYFENLLFDNGSATFFKLDNKIFVGSKSGSSDFDINNEPINFNVISLNSKVSLNVTNENAVIMKNNSDELATIQLIYDYIIKLVKIWNSDNNNLALSNKHFLVAGKPQHFGSLSKQAEDLLNIENTIIFIDKDDKGINKFIKTDIKDMIIDFDVNYTPEKYTKHFQEIYNQTLCKIGIEHNSSSKNERNVTDEVMLSNKETQTIIKNMFTQRKIAIEKINSIFNLDIKIKEVEKIEEKKDVKNDNETIL